MKISEVIKKLQEFDPEGSLLFQYRDIDGTWPIYPFSITKVPGNNSMVVIQPDYEAVQFLNDLEKSR